jgi:hypothetical protein
MNNNPKTKSLHIFVYLFIGLISFVLIQPTYAVDWPKHLVFGAPLTGTTNYMVAVGILKLPRGAQGIAVQPIEVRLSGVGGWEGGMAFDATKLFKAAHYFTRPHYPIVKVDLEKWFTAQKLKEILAMQTDYAFDLGKRGW